MAERRCRYRLRFRSPVGVFTGLGIAGLVDRTVVRDAAGLPVIPGSTVKGRLRFFAERVLRAAPEEPGSYSIHGVNRPHCKDPADACTLCRLFGNPSLPAGVRVGPAKIPRETAELFGRLLGADRNPVLRPDVDLRPGIAVSRRRRSALPNFLFFDAPVPAVTFHARLRLSPAPGDPELQFLVGVGHLVDALGARKAAGRGCLDGGVIIEVDST